MKKLIQTVFASAIIAAIFISCGEENVLVPLTTHDSTAENRTKIMGDWHLKTVTTINYGYDNFSNQKFRYTSEVIYQAAADYNTNTTDENGFSVQSSGFRQKMIVNFSELQNDEIFAQNFPHQSSSSIEINGNTIYIVNWQQEYRILELSDKRLVVAQFQAQSEMNFVETTLVMQRPDAVLPAPTKPNG